MADRRDCPLHHVLLVRLPARGEEGENLIVEAGQQRRKSGNKYLILKRKVRTQKSESVNLIVESRVVRAPKSKELNEPLVEHLLPFCHHIPFQVAKGLLAREWDLEELWKLGRQSLVEQKEVAVSA